MIYSMKEPSARLSDRQASGRRLSIATAFHETGRSVVIAANIVESTLSWQRAAVYLSLGICAIAAYANFLQVTLARF